MLGIMIALLVTVWVSYMLIKKYKPQAILLLAGITLLLCTAIFGLGTLVPAKQSTGLIWFDVFEAIKGLMSNRRPGIAANANHVSHSG